MRNKRGKGKSGKHMMKTRTSEDSEDENNSESLKNDDDEEENKEQDSSERDIEDNDEGESGEEKEAEDDDEITISNDDDYDIDEDNGDSDADSMGDHDDDVDESEGNFEDNTDNSENGNVKNKENLTKGSKMMDRKKKTNKMKNREKPPRKQKKESLDDQNSEDEDADEDSELDFLDDHDDAEFSSSVPEEEDEDDEDEPEDEEEAGSFSFSDVETDESKKEEESLSYHSPYEIPSELEDMIEDGLPEPEPEIQYRKLPKYVSSDTTEYETIYDESEKEEDNQNKEELHVEQPKEEERPPSIPDPFSWIEYNREIDYLEPFDGGWLEKLFSRDNNPSGTSSADESFCDDSHKSIRSKLFDKPSFKLPDEKFSVVRNRHYKDSKYQSKRKHTAIKNMESEESENEKKKTKGRKKRKGCTLRLDVYNHASYPSYESHDSTNKRDDQAVSRLNQNSEDETFDIKAFLFQLKPPFKETSKEEHIRAKKIRNIVKKGKHMLKRRKRDAAYLRLHPWYSWNNHLDSDGPQEDIPSVKIKKKSYKVQDKVIEETMNILLRQTFTAIKEIEKTRAKMVKEYYNERRAAVEYAIESILDLWEEHVYVTRLNLIEVQLEKMSEMLVKNCLIHSINRVINEDNTVVSLVRTTLAESLVDLGYKKPKILKYINVEFRKYDLESFNFKSETRSKSYKPRKNLDFYVKARNTKSKALDLKAKQEIFEKKKTKEKEKKLLEKEKKEQLKKEIIKREEAIEDQKRKLKEMKNEKEKGFLSIFKKVGHSFFLSPEHSENEKELEHSYTELNIDKEKAIERTHQMILRTKVVDIWKDSMTDLVKAKRREYAKRFLESDVESEVDAAVLNMKYNTVIKDEEEEEQLGFEISSVDRLALPDLKTEIALALKKDEIPQEIKPYLKPDIIDRTDSALGSEIKTDHLNDASNLPALTKRESGIYSNEDIQDKVQDVKNTPALSQSEFEKTIPYDQIIKSIPKIDRELYLQNWLENETTPLPLQVEPSPQVYLMNVKKRKLRAKRPPTVLSEATTYDAAPVDDVMLEYFRNRRYLEESQGDVNNRPYSSSTVYTEIESIKSLQKLEIFEEKKQEEVKSKTESFSDSKVTNIPRKLNFEKWKVVERENKIDRTDYAAWKFYLKQKAKTRKQLSNKNNFVVDLKNEEREAIIKQIGQDLLKDNIELLGKPQDLDYVLKIKDPGGHDLDETLTLESLSPPPTPWEMITDRPLTPDTEDEEQRLEVLRSKYLLRRDSEIKHIPRSYRKIRHIDSDDAERRWRTFMRKRGQGYKEKQLPPLTPSRPSHVWSNNTPSGNNSAFKRLQQFDAHTHNRLPLQTPPITARSNPTSRRVSLQIMTLKENTELYRRIASDGDASPKLNRRQKSMPSYLKPTQSTLGKVKTKERVKLPPINVK